VGRSEALALLQEAMRIYAAVNGVEDEATKRAASHVADVRTEAGRSHDTQGLALIQSLTSGGALVEVLDFRGCCIGSSGAELLGRVLAGDIAVGAALRVLDLTSNYVGDDGLVGLAVGLAPALEELILADNEFTDPGAEAVGRAMGRRDCWPALRVLRMRNRCSGSQNHVRCAGVAALAEALGRRSAFPALEVLDLRFQAVGDTGFAALGGALQQGGPASLPRLRALLLGGNKAEDAGAAALLSALGAPGMCPSLQDLSLDGCQLGYHSEKALGPAVQQHLELTTLSLGGCGLMSLDALADQLGKAGGRAQLRRLNLRKNYFRGSTDWPVLANSLARPGVAAALQELILSENALGDAGLALLGKVLATHGALPALRTLMLEGVEAGDQGFVALAEGLKACQALEVRGVGMVCGGIRG
jgi:Ran GTPase-activating protein (RanGAP) involved in mRNA processing and transport